MSLSEKLALFALGFSLISVAGVLFNQLRTIKCLYETIEYKDSTINSLERIIEKRNARLKVKEQTIASLRTLHNRL